MNKIFLLTPYGNDYHTGHVVLLGPDLASALDALIEREGTDAYDLPRNFLGQDGEKAFLEHTFPGCGYEYWYMDAPWEERTPELLIKLRDFIIAADLPWEVINPNLSVPMVLAEYDGGADVTVYTYDCRATGYRSPY